MLLYNFCIVLLGVISLSGVVAIVTLLKRNRLLKQSVALQEKGLQQMREEKIEAEQINAAFLAHHALREKGLNEDKKELLERINQLINSNRLVLNEMNGLIELNTHLQQNNQKLLMAGKLRIELEKAWISQISKMKLYIDLLQNENIKLQNEGKMEAEKDLFRILKALNITLSKGNDGTENK